MCFFFNYTGRANKWSLLLSNLSKLLDCFSSDWLTVSVGIDMNAYIPIFQIHFQITLWFWILIFNIQNFYFRLRGDDGGCRFDFFVWRLQWCLTVFDCSALIFNMSPCILLFLHLQMAGRTDGNPNLINYKRNILDQHGMAWQPELEPTLITWWFTLSWIVKYCKLDIISCLFWINYLMLGKIFLKVSNKNNKIPFVEVFGKNNLLKESLINNVSKWSSSHPGRAYTEL